MFYSHCAAISIGLGAPGCHPSGMGVVITMWTGGVVALLLNHRLIAGNPPGSGNGDSCLELDFILEDCRSIDAEGGQAPGGEAEGLL